MSDIIFVDYLRSFGLTGQEAVIYELLLGSDAMTGYEVSKASGISRSNAYGSLSGLVEKGAAYLIEGEPSRYISVDIDRFCDNTLRELNRQADYLKGHAPVKTSNDGGYINVQGSRHIRDMIRHMLSVCKKRLYISAKPSIIEEFKTELEELIAKDVKVVIITDDYELEGAIDYHGYIEEYQIRLITDSEYVLTGELKDLDSDICLYSKQKNLVSVMKEALKNKIELIKIDKEIQR